jgi:DNA-binding MarR family transcriptional regulator
MVATRRKGTLMLLSRLSKTAMRATPESEMGMSIRHFSALHSISGAMPQQQLAETLCIDANNTVLILNELETLGWVRRERDPHDRRRHLVVVTDEGLAAYRRAQEARDVVEDEVLGPLSSDERQHLHDLLAKALGEA